VATSAVLLQNFPPDGAVSRNAISWSHILWRQTTAWKFCACTRTYRPMNGMADFRFDWFLLTVCDNELTMHSQNERSNVIRCEADNSSSAQFQHTNGRAVLKFVNHLNKRPGLRSWLLNLLFNEKSWVTMGRHLGPFFF
jgi:hypothetical protein